MNCAPRWHHADVAGGVARCARRVQEFAHVRGKRRLEKDLFEVVDEMRAAERPNARDLGLAARLEKHVRALEGEPGDLEESLRRHPRPRRLAKIGAALVVGGQFGLVRHDKQGDAAVAAGAHEGVCAVDQPRLRHQRTVHQRLQLLPRDVAVRPEPDLVAYRALAGR
jgi:hypothetical protein